MDTTQNQPQSREEVLAKIHEWDYSGANDVETKIPLEIFYQEEKSSFEERVLTNLNANH